MSEMSGTGAMGAIERWFRSVIAVVGAVALVVGIACGGDGGNANSANTSNASNNKPGEVKIPDTTKVFGDAELAALASVSKDLATLEFSSEAGKLATLAERDVVVTGVFGDKLPYGMLRRVTKIARGGGKVTLTTEQATLTDAIEKGSLNETVTLVPSDVASTSSPLIAGVDSQHYATKEDDMGFVYAFNDLELYDADDDPSTRGDRVWADGNVAFKPILGFQIEIDGFSLQKLTFEVGANQTATIQATAGREATFSETRTLETIELQPITFSIGPVPIVLIPRIAFLAGIEGVITAELVAGVSEDITARVGFGYQDGSWDPIGEFTPHAQFDAPEFRDGAKGEAQLWAGPRASLALYGVAGVYGELRAFVRGKIDSTASPWWTLSAGIQALAGVFVEVLDTTIVDHHLDPLEQSLNLADAGGPAPSGKDKVITWSRSLGGTTNDNTDNPLAIISTPEGGSLLVGGTNSFTNSPSDAWIVKLDRLGQISWQRAFEDAQTIIAVRPTADGGYLLLAGVVGTGANDTNLIKVDANGDPVWNKLLKADKNLAGYTLVKSGSDFIIGGLYGSGIGADCWLAAIDQAGSIKWSRAFGGDEDDQIQGMTVTPDGSLLAVGATHSFGVTNNGHWLVKLDASGAIKWQYVFDSDGSDNEWGTDVVVDSTGDYRVIGRLGGDALVTRVGADGTLKGAYRYDTGPYDEAYAGVATSDGGLLLAGKVGLGDAADLWLLRLTAQDEVQWTTGYGGVKGEDAGGTIQYAWTSTPIAPTDDGGYLVIANTQSFGATFWDVWINKVSSTGAISYEANSGATRTALAGTFQEYPLTRAPTSAKTVDVAITTTSPVLKPYTPAPRTVVQAKP